MHILCSIVELNSERIVVRNTPPQAMDSALRLESWATRQHSTARAQWRRTRTRRLRHHRPDTADHSTSCHPPLCYTSFSCEEASFVRCPRVGDVASLCVTQCTLPLRFCNLFPSLTRQLPLSFSCAFDCRYGGPPHSPMSPYANQQQQYQHQQYQQQPTHGQGQYGAY